MVYLPYMATLLEYYETDFSNLIKVHIKLKVDKEEIDGIVLYDFVALTAFISCYVPDENRTYEFFMTLLQHIAYNLEVIFEKRITLPDVKSFPGALEIKNEGQIEILAQFYGETRWVSSNEIQASKRVFIYSETQLNSEQLTSLQGAAVEMNRDLQIRSEEFRKTRSNQEHPLAFISHDSRDKEKAKAIAIGLKRKMCPVWYDEFSLKVGDSLRESIEKGLKECKKCVLILTPNFFSNNGWTKVEFDSIFTREIIEQQKLVLPVWAGVTKEEVYEYSPSLLNIVGLNWDSLGEDEVIAQLHKSIEV